MRVDALEDEAAKHAELLATLKTFVKITKVWAPIIATAALSGAASNPNVWAAVQATFHALQ